ncbi:GNAT family N-acetyltransferase [Sphingomonas crocodyli]|uniref:GNAT family N-acetyltransferase n=1 Tax=Sphingomonas crocodyli TaxID=1979270 RepID=A0A437M4G2_9SPHN|nr:GNAT family N-acetyltransferase [Sphingomonas crocodyli]RVT92476.1 GNAT family N-acetyltransferase [Sphingomonas crocodyli]
MIRAARPEDAPALAALKLETFRQTFLTDGFAIPYPPADLAIFERDSYDPAVVAREIADPGRATWVAERDGTLIAYAQVGPSKLPHPDVREGHGELYQLYALKSAQGLGLGGQLLDLTLNHLGETRPGPIWLGVWSGNLKAQAVYAKRGFSKVGEYEFPVGAWRDHEFIFRRG